MRKPLIAGNWKLHLTRAESLELSGALKEELWDLTEREVVVAPVFTSLAEVSSALRGTPLQVAAQDLFWEEQGAWTGEVSATLLKDAGCSGVIVGHSERRQHFGETDADVNRKAAAALRGGLTPIVCVGERLEEREAGSAEKIVGGQIEGALAGFTAAEAAAVVLAYEPLWAIGTGKTATPEQADDMHAFARGLISRLYGDTLSDSLRILYGGSVKPENVDELMARPHIDGALVGGASLKAESFVRIARFQGR